MKLIHFKQGQNNSHADPFILKGDDGKFYIYVSGRAGVYAFCSESLLGEYSDLGIVFSEEGKMEYWAPSVIYLDGKYYMYVSFVNDGEEDVHQQTMHVATSDKPFGPFSDPKPLIAPFSIDSHVVSTEAGLFILYSTNDYGAERPGTYIAVDKMKSPFEAEGAPVMVVKATLDEEIFMKNRFGDGRNWHTIEGAFYFREGNHHYIMYSGNCYQNEYYFLGYSYAYTEERDLTKIKFEKMPAEDIYAPVIAKNEFETGTGHNSVIKEDGEYYCVYHGRDIPPDPRIKGDNRTARICKLVLDGKNLTAERYENKI